MKVSNMTKIRARLARIATLEFDRDMLKAAALRYESAGMRKTAKHTRDGAAKLDAAIAQYRKEIEELKGD
jgi:hypothetical protein